MKFTFGRSNTKTLIVYSSFEILGKGRKENEKALHLISSSINHKEVFKNRCFLVFQSTTSLFCMIAGHSPVFCVVFLAKNLI